MVARTISESSGLEVLLAAVREGLDSFDSATISAHASAAVPRLAPAATAGAVALSASDGRVFLSGSGDVPAQDSWDTGLAGVPGAKVLARGRIWQPCDAPIQGVLLPPGWPVPVLGVPLVTGEGLRGALYAFNATGRRLPAGQGRALETFGAYVSMALGRAALFEEATQAQRGLARMMAITAGIAQRLDFSTIAQRIVDGLTAVTDFRCAAVTLRSGETCRRMAASGLAEPRIGLETPFEQWEGLLCEQWRRGEITFLIPPEAPAKWSDFPNLPYASDDPNAWTAGHGLVIVLRDPDYDTVGFLSVDEPRSGRLPDDRTVENLELFARQVEVALVNARMYSALRHAAERDMLTGLRNRRVCWTDMEPAVASASPEAPLALAVVDVDEFKAINDRHGHAVGDLALRHIADRLTRSVRETDRVYRIGGEEFVVALPGTGEQEAEEVLQRVRASVKRTREDLPPLTVSIGLAQAPADGQTMDALFKAADTALYAAKHSGKDRVVTAGRLEEGPTALRQRAQYLVDERAVGLLHDERVTRFPAEHEPHPPEGLLVPGEDVPHGIGIEPRAARRETEPVE